MKLYGPSAPLIIWIVCLALLSQAPAASAYVARNNAESAAGSAHVREAAVANDYYAHLKTHVTWKKFPVVLYFVHDREYSETREQEARVGFSRWEQATNGFVSYVVTSDPKRANIRVVFNPNTDDGLTTTHYAGKKIAGADVSIGVSQGWHGDVECIAAHEFAHALGINGHSYDRTDLMYPLHILGTDWQISQRDLNTLAALYQPAPRLSIVWTPVSGEASAPADIR